MATVVKDFKIKSGLVVEGTTGTINNFDILTKKQTDQDYIVGLIGGTSTSENTPNTVVKRDSSGNFAAQEVTVFKLNLGSVGYIEDDSEIVIANTDGDDIRIVADDVRLEADDDIVLTSGVNGNTVDADIRLEASYGRIRLEGADVYAGTNLQFVDSERVATRGYVDTAADSAQADAETFATDADTALYGTVTTDIATAKTAAELTASTALAGAVEDLEAYADQAEADAISTASADATSKANAAQSAAEATASADATSKANAAQSAAEATASADATTKANAALAAAEDYADGLAVNYDAFGAAAAAQAAAEQHADEAVAALVGSAPAVLDTIQELATALENNPDIIADLQDIAAGKQDTLTPGANIDITGATISVTGLDTDDVSEGSNQYFTDFRAQEAVSDVLGTGLNYGDQGDGNVFHVDENHISTKAYAESVADTAYENAQDYAELKASDAQAAAIETASQDATTKANNALAAAEDYADGLAVNYDAAGSAATAEQNAKDYADTLAGGLDTDDIEEGSSNLYHTDVRAKSAAAALLTSATKTNITITGNGAGLTITAENGVADSTTNDLAEGTGANPNLYFTDARAVDALQGTEPVFQTVSLDEVALQVAGSLSASTAGVQTAYSWAKADYRSAEFLVKVAYGTHTEISKVLLTLDTSDNIALTEYGIVGTNGSASSISAGVSGDDVELLVTTTNNTSTVTVVGTLLV